MVKDITIDYVEKISRKRLWDKTEDVWIYLKIQREARRIDSDWVVFAHGILANGQALQIPKHLPYHIIPRPC